MLSCKRSGLFFPDYTYFGVSPIYPSTGKFSSEKLLHFKNVYLCIYCMWANMYVSELCCGGQRTAWAVSACLLPRGSRDGTQVWCLTHTFNLLFFSYPHRLNQILIMSVTSTAETTNEHRPWEGQEWWIVVKDSLAHVTFEGSVYYISDLL